ncbi:MAG: ruvC [Parcubacteria group bacterium]|nr:ruvC [Parcubacteria group bacterium]
MSTPTQNKSDRVLAIDPGYDRLGYAVLEKIKGKESIVVSGCITTDRKASAAERLKGIGDGIRRVIEDTSPSALSIEKLFFNQNVTTALRVAEARGVVLYEAARASLSIHEYSPQDVKIAVTGYGKAAKNDVERMIEKLIVLPTLPKGTKRLDDELDAVALGITHLVTRHYITKTK